MRQLERSDIHAFRLFNDIYLWNAVRDRKKKYATNGVKNKEMKEYMRRFRVVREKDISGVSGTGYVAEGVLFRSGQCSVCWRSDHSSINIYKSLEDVIFVHGHGGTTKVEFIDPTDDPELVKN